MLSFSASSILHARRITQRIQATFGNTTATCSSNSEIENAENSLLCNAAVNALRRVYQYQNSLPQSSGCAHALGRIAESVRQDSINQLSNLFNTDAKRTTLHASPQHLALSIFDLLNVGERGKDQVILSLYDDPKWSGPIAAKCVSLGVTVCWLTDYSAGTVANVMSSRTGLMAIQLLSPLNASVSEHVLDAMQFAKSADIHVILDVTHALAADTIRLNELPADTVVIGGDAIRAHSGAAIAFWSTRVWERSGRLFKKKFDRCASGDIAPTPALTSFAASMTQVIRICCNDDGSCRLHESNRHLAVCLHNALLYAFKRPSFVHVQHVTNLSSLRPLQHPSIALSISIPGAVRSIARRLFNWDPNLTYSARLSVFKKFSYGRKKREVHRDELLYFEFTSLMHSESDVNRFMERFADFVDDAVDTSI